MASQQSIADAERTVLGAILVDNGAFPSARRLSLQDFSDRRHRATWRAMGSLDRAQLPIDLVTLKDTLLKTGDLELAGGVAYLASLVDGVPRIENVSQWSRIMKEQTRRRRVAALGEEIRAAAKNGCAPADLQRLAEELQAEAFA